MTLALWNQALNRHGSRVPVVTMRGSRVHLVGHLALGVVTTRCGRRIAAGDVRAALVGGEWAAGGPWCLSCYPEETA